LIVTGSSPRVVLISLDAFDHASIGPESAPRMWGLAVQGGIARGGGSGEMPSVTYVCHASMLTGASPSRHGVTSNAAPSGHPGAVPGWAGERQVRVPTLFDACRAAGIRTAAIAGDWHILTVAGALPGMVDVRWPMTQDPDGAAERDAFGYVTNRAIREPLLAAASDPSIRFLFGHLNETDTAGHIHGPGAPATAVSYAETDAIVGAVLDALHPRWDETVVFVVSDHGMETMREDGVIDLTAHPELDAVLAGSMDEGGAALALVREGVSGEEAGSLLRAIPGIGAWRETSPGVLLLEAEPGYVFARGVTKHTAGIHGGPGTQRTAAIVGGGHPSVPIIAERLAVGEVSLRDWAPIIAGLFGLSLPDAEGRNLAG
jgi:arylsulfatase A-like enzyme